ncbi:Topoisomerase 1-associated factor 1 [Dinochytrium kinnereticum]|nr:Topoisomerase 1-associated factor 1 [Dinochytrium kinnereticum]
MDKNQEKYLLSICSALGGYEEREAVEGEGLSGKHLVYVPGDEVAECLKDLKRILRKDDMTSERLVFLTLGKWEVLQNHLIPILLNVDVESNIKLVTSIVELFVPMTWPVDENSTEKVNHSHLLRSYKEAFLREGVLSKIMQLLVRIIAQPHRDRNTSDEARIRIILFLFRNLLAIRDPISSATSSTEGYLHSILQEQLLVALKKANILQLVITIAGSLRDREFSDWKAIILEIIYYIFRDRRPGDVAERTQTELSRLLKDEKVQKVGAQVISSRHSRFGGTLAIDLGNGRLANIHQQASKAMHSIGDSLDLGKKNGRTTKMKTDIMKQAITTKPRSIVTTEAFEVLRSTADLFLENAFNVFLFNSGFYPALVDAIKKDIDMERNTVDEAHHLQLLKVITFFLEYQTLKIKNKDDSGRFGFDTVTDILNVRGVVFILRRIGMYDAEKKTKSYDLHIALDCFKQLLVSLDCMSKSENEEWKEASANIQNNLYYEHSTTELIIKLCKNFKGPNPEYLKSLLETIHILLNMLKSYSKEKKSMIIRRKKRAKKAKPKKTGNAAVDDGIVAEDVLSEDEEHRTDEYVEHEFRFEKIELEFASESVVDTYCELLSQFEMLEDKYFQMITVMFHRIFVKLDLQAFFYRLSILELFSRVVKLSGPASQASGYKGLYHFISFLMKQFAKRASDNPLLYVELLFPKTRADCIRIQSNRPYELTEGPRTLKAMEYSYEKEDSLTWKQKIDFAITYLMKRHRSVLEWLMITLSEVAAYREHRTFVEKQDLEEKSENIDFFTPTNVRLTPLSTATSDRQRKALRKNRHFHILLRLLRLEEDVANPDAPRWCIPEAYHSDELHESSNIIKSAMPLREKHVKKRGKGKESLGDGAALLGDDNSDGDSSEEDEDVRPTATTDMVFDEDVMDAALLRHEEEALAKSQADPVPSEIPVRADTPKRSAAERSLIAFCFDEEEGEESVSKKSDDPVVKPVSSHPLRAFAMDEDCDQPGGESGDGMDVESRSQDVGREKKRGNGELGSNDVEADDQRESVVRGFMSPASDAKRMRLAGMDAAGDDPVMDAKENTAPEVGIVRTGGVKEQRGAGALLAFEDDDD